MAKESAEKPKADESKQAQPEENGSAETRPEAPLTSQRLWVLALLALGVVFGDIGTSPLYAIRVCFNGEYGVPVSGENVLGVLSLIFWSLIWVPGVHHARRQRR